MMGETLDNNDLDVNVNMEAIKKSNNRIKSHKCSKLVGGIKTGGRAKKIAMRVLRTHDKRS